MYEEGQAASLASHTTDLLDVLRMAVTLVASSQSQQQQLPAKAPSVPQTAVCQHQDIHCLLQHALHLVHVLIRCLTPPPAPQSSSLAHQILHQQQQQLAVNNREHLVTLHTLVAQLIRLQARGHDGRSLLHMAVDKATGVVDDETYSSFPSVETASLLLDCGAEPNAVDAQGDTALHVCSRQLAAGDSCDAAALERTVRKLVERGVHVDTRNKQRQSAADHPALAGPLRLHDHISLKCLAAAVVRQHGIPFEDEIPANLVSFVLMH